MKYSLLLPTLVLSLGFSISGLADKPKWAGEGGKPTAEGKVQHKEEMTSKNKEIEKEKEKEKDKNKNKNKDKDNDNDKDKDKDKD